MIKTASDTTGQLTDLRMPPRPREPWHWIRLILAAGLCLFFFIFLSTAFTFLFDNSVAGVILAGVLVGVGCWALFFATSKHEAGALLESVDLDDLPGSLVKEWPKLPKGQELRFLPALTTRLAEERRFGETYRLQGYDGFDQIVPIDVPFEPIPLDQPEKAAETDGRAGVVTDDEDGSTADRRSTSSNKPPWYKRSLERTWAWPAIFLVMFLSKLYTAITTQRVSWGLLIFGLALSGYVINYLFGQTASRRQWFLTPSGLVVRTAVGGGYEWRLSLLDRRDSILLIWSSAYDRNFIWIKTSGEGHEITATHDQTVQLLRAWLSPLPPPSMEQLSDLA